MLPDGLEWVLEMLGFDWPKADEDKMRECAQVWRDFADQVDELNYRALSAANSVRSANSGDSVDAFGKAFDKFSTGGDGYLADAAQAARLIAAAFEAAAVIVITCKIAVIAQLVILAAEIIAAQAAAPFTFGLSEVGALGATQATKMIVRRLLKELRDALIEAIMETLKDPIVSAVQAMIKDLIAQTVNQGFGAQDGYDLGRTVKKGWEEGKSSAENWKQTFGESLKDGLGSRAGGAARHHADRAAGHGESGGHEGGGEHGSGNGTGNGNGNGEDSGSSSNSSGSSGSSGSSDSSGTSGGSGSTGTSRSHGSGSSSGSSPSGSRNSSGDSGNGGADHTPSVDNGNSGEGGTGNRSESTPRPAPAPAPASDHRSATPLDPFGTRLSSDSAPAPAADTAAPAHTGTDSRPAPGSDGPVPASGNGRGADAPPAHTGTDSRPNPPAHDGSPDGPAHNGDAPADRSGADTTRPGPTTAHPAPDSAPAPAPTPASHHAGDGSPAPAHGGTPHAGDSGTAPHPGGDATRPGPVSAHTASDSSPAPAPTPAPGGTPAGRSEAAPSAGPHHGGDSGTPSHAGTDATRPGPVSAHAAPDSSRTPTPSHEAGSPSSRPSPDAGPTPAHAQPAQPHAADAHTTAPSYGPVRGSDEPSGRPSHHGDGRPSPSYGPVRGDAPAGTAAQSHNGPEAGRPGHEAPLQRHEPTPRAEEGAPQQERSGSAVPPHAGSVPHVPAGDASRTPSSDGPPRATVHTASTAVADAPPTHTPGTPAPDSAATPSTGQPSQNPGPVNPGPVSPGASVPPTTGTSGTGSANTPRTDRPTTGTPNADRPTLPGQRNNPGPDRTDRPTNLGRQPAAGRPDPRTGTPRPDATSRPDPRADRPAADRPTGTPEHRLPEADRHGDEGANTPKVNPQHSAPDHTTPDHKPGDHDSPDHTTPDHKPVDPDRPATADRPHGSPGGLVEPSHHDRERVENSVPRDADGKPQRHPDPEGDWPRAINGDPDAPGRHNNCVDVALATVDTYSGHPTPAAARTPDHDADGNPSDRGERGGRDRIENALGARFSDMGDGKDAYRRLEDTLRREGHGSQAVIITRDADGRAHAWNAANHNGKITYIDAQTGRRSNQPLHSGDHGVFAIPLSPDRRPASPHTDPGRSGHTRTDSRPDRRAPAEAAGTKHKLDHEGDDGSAAKKPKTATDPEGPGKPKVTARDEVEGSAEYGTKQDEKHEHHGRLADPSQKTLREGQDVQQTDPSKAFAALEAWERDGSLQKLFDESAERNTLKGENVPRGFTHTELVHALDGFADLHPSQRGAVVAVLARMNVDFHRGNAVGYALGGRPDGYEWSNPNSPRPPEGRSWGAHFHKKFDMWGTSKSPARNIYNEMVKGFGNREVGTSWAAYLRETTNGTGNALDMSGRNFAVLEVKDPDSGETHYVVDSSAPGTAKEHEDHSEPHVGKYFDEVNKARVAAGKNPMEAVHLYTEREPCGRSSGGGRTGGIKGTNDCSIYIRNSPSLSSVDVSYSIGYRAGKMSAGNVHQNAVQGQKADTRWYMRNIEVLWMRMGIRRDGSADA
ncbi:toxin glutamine deamidase domain-containing protein [Kitasatospora sp. DSM 101779]|uniref:toxin glutamine deamidase domain-containing protein n=1 Tax=Kitasatospora sp. DSM 101779 TaxID=2853165 RepID=UPI0021D8C3A7|nr:toxin glutamine deamidase domain-containing protein [Kitasatospora sp. DSM 101779]